MNAHEEKVTVTLSFCVTRAEAREIYRESARQRCSVSAFLRHLLALHRPAPAGDQINTVETLSKNPKL